MPLSQVIVDGAIVAAQGNTDRVLLASAARTATVDGEDQTTPTGRGVLLALQVTDVGDAAPGITLKLQYKTPLGDYVTLLTGPAITETGTYVVILHPAAEQKTGGEAVALVQRYPLPLTWRVRVEHANADPITYAVGATVVL